MRCANALPVCWKRLAWATNYGDPVVIFPEANNSVWPSPERWLTIRKVILADEPTGNLDTANSERAFELLQNIVQQGGKALLLATHNPVIAEACDWIHEMKDGHITTSHSRGNRTSNFENSGN